jgi:hypothetical protein
MGDGGRQNSLKIPAHLPLINIYQMIPLSAKSISLDSTFKVVNTQLRILEMNSKFYFQNWNAQIVAW